MASILRVRDENGNVIDIPAIVGPQGPKGDPGNDYVLTDTDKQEIISAVLNALPTAEGVGF